MTKPMIVISWNDTYTVHVASIDAQHKKIMGLINDLNRVSQSGDAAQIEAALEGLAGFTREHFEYEESFLEKYHYPFLKSHREKHLVFLKTIEKAGADLRSGRARNIGRTVSGLVQWLKNHIVLEDKQYSCFMLEHGVK